MPEEPVQGGLQWSLKLARDDQHNASRGDNAFPQTASSDYRASKHFVALLWTSRQLTDGALFSELLP